MSTVHCRIAICLSRNRAKDAPWLWLDEQRDFDEIVRLGVHDPTESNVANGWLRVCVSANDVRLGELLAIAARAGCVPAETLEVKPEDYGRKFEILRVRIYKRKDIISAPLLRMFQKATGGIIAKGFHPGNPLQLKGDALRAYVAQQYGNQDNGWTLDSTYRGNLKVHVGALDLRGVFLCDDDGKSILEDEELKRLAFREARYDAERKGNRRLWFLSSEIVMPKCLTRRCDQKYNVCNTNDVDGAMWVDGQYLVAELTFSREEVESLEGFDVAYTRERVGPHSSLMHSELIVSQRFREVLERRKLATVGFVPVRIVEKASECDLSGR